MKLRVLTQIIFLSFSNLSLSAADFEELLFRDGGRRVLPSEFEQGMTVAALNSKVVRPCTSNPSLICIKWKFVSARPQDEAQYLPGVQAAVGLWNNLTTSNLRFEYDGFSTTLLHTPYRFHMQGGIPTTTPETDQFGNNIIEGDFIISMAGAPLKPDETPEFTFESGVASHTMKYSRPNAAGSMSETLWAGIYLNPDFQIGETCSYDGNAHTGTYNLIAVIAHEMGRVIGLSPSPNNASVLYPICPTSAQSTGLSADDARSVSAKYPATGFIEEFGSLSGRVKKGEDGSALAGAQIHIVPIEHLTDLARRWIVATVQSRADGAFKFVAVPPGNYILIVEPLIATGLLHSDFDDWMSVFGGDDVFSMEFYDGHSRESNHEAALAFSPQSAIYAATLPVVAGEINENVEVITNIADEHIAAIEAMGATHETLSQYTPTRPNPDLSKENEDAAKFASKPSGFGLGGCEVGANGSGEVLFALTILGFLSILSLRLQYRRKIMARSPSRPLTKSERTRSLDRFRIRFHRFTNQPSHSRHGRRS